METQVFQEIPQTTWVFGVGGTLCEVQKPCSTPKGFGAFVCVCVFRYLWETFNGDLSKGKGLQPEIAKAQKYSLFMYVFVIFVLVFFWGVLYF